MDNNNLKIAKELNQLVGIYEQPIDRVEGLSFNQKELIRTIEFYSDSKYLQSQKDNLGRDKPFYNIVNAMCDVESSAKDLDTKDVTITSDDGEHYLQSFLMSKDVYQWMKQQNFAKFLNDVRDAHSRYGSVLIKKRQYKDDNKKVLKLELPEWKNLITDQVDILGGAIIERHYMLPSQLVKMTEWTNISDALKLAKKDDDSPTTRRINIWEVRGEFPVSFYKEAEGLEITADDENTFSYQLYYFAGDIGGQLIKLYCEDDTERVYKYLARKPKTGRAFGVGIVEEGTQAQMWVNDAVLKQQRAMEFTSKVIGQTATKKLRGRNILTDLDNGQIIEHDENKPISQVPLLPTGGLGQYQQLLNQWYTQFEKTTSAYAAQRGEAPPSGTPFRLQAMLLNQSGTVFQDLQEELGIFITELFNDWIMPFLGKQLNTEHILAHEFSPDELKEIDKNFALNEANEKAKQMILDGKIVTSEQYQSYIGLVGEVLGRTKSQRFIKVPTDFYKGMQAKTSVNITGESRNKAAVLESLSNIMMLYAKNPTLAKDPVLKQLFMRIVELSGAGISPVSLQGALAAADQMQQQAAMQPQGQPQQPNAAASMLSQLSLAAKPNDANPAIA